VSACLSAYVSRRCEGLIDQMHTDLGHINVYDIYTPCIMDMEKEEEELRTDYRAPFSAERAERFGADTRCLFEHVFDLLMPPVRSLSWQSDGSSS
jgi:hypothetical protein